MKLKSHIYKGFAVLLFIIAFYPALQILVAKWISSDEYSHAFIVFPLICYMIWIKRDLISQVSKKYSYLGLLLLIPSIAIYYFALLTEVHTIILLSMYFSIIGTCIYVFGLASVKILLTPFFLLLLLIPVPEQLYTFLTFPLQLKVSEISEIILRSFHIPMLRQGNVMQIPGMSFEVIEACSGLRSVVALFTLSVIMGSFTVRFFSSKLILLAASIPLAIIVNIMRVVSMILLYHYFLLDLTEGVWHTITGLLVFTIAISFLLLLQKVLESWEQKKI
jgi:exosortase